MKICITADSTCDIPKEQALAYDIDILPLSIVRGEEMLRDGLDIMPDDIFQFVQAGNPIPKTTAVNVSEYREVFERRLRENDAILHINRIGFNKTRKGHTEVCLSLVQKLTFPSKCFSLGRKASLCALLSISLPIGYSVVNHPSICFFIFINSHFYHFLSLTLAAS